MSNILSEIIQGDVDEIISELFLRAQPHAIRNRVLVKATAQTKKKMARVASVDKDLAEAFNMAYTSFNMKNGIRAMNIKPSDSQYPVLKEVARQAQDFCDMYELDQSAGFEAYLAAAYRLAGNKYSIYYLKGMAERIIKDREVMLALSNDSNRDGTRAFYAAWKLISIQYLGSAASIENPAIYIHFMYGREAADEAKADYKEWIAAQFEGIKVFGSTPELNQLYGDNAHLRYTKYTGNQKQEYKNESEKKYFTEGKVKAKAPQRRNIKKKS